MGSGRGHVGVWLTSTVMKPETVAARSKARLYSVLSSSVGAFLSDWLRVDPARFNLRQHAGIR